MILKAKNINIEIIRCNNVNENINNDINVLFKKHDIKWELTILNNLYQNDMIESLFRIIFNRVHVCLYNFKLFKYFWKWNMLYNRLFKKYQFLYNIKKKLYTKLEIIKS